MTINIRNVIINRAVNFLPHLSDKQISDILKMAEKVVYKKSREVIKKYRLIFEKNPVMLAFARTAIRRMNYNCRKKLIENLLMRGFVENTKIRDDNAENGHAPLVALLISPTMRCNLSCPGCYAKNYEKDQDLPFRDFDRTVREAKKMGAAFFTVLGGEPFLYKNLFDIFEKHSDAYFQVYTNGLLITESICKKLAELGNVACQFSIEGLEEENNFRRGEGTFQKILCAMDLMKEHGVPFGYSVCVTKKNIESVVSETFVDAMIEKGAFIAWHFLYMPVCGDSNIDLMPSPRQRIFLKEKIESIRASKPLLAIDFWNDAPVVGGCIAGKYYCHINSNGDVEPCIFTHFSQANIKDVSLQEALDFPFYKELRKIQPYSKNLQLPCMLIDHPNVMRRLHKKYRLKPTHKGAEKLLNGLHKEIDSYSKEVKKLYKG